MSIYGTGVDLCDISRVEKSLEKHGSKFTKKILHINEQKIMATLKLQSRYLAKRFAAKEAFAKALGTGIAKGVTLPDIEISNDSNGKPLLILHGEANSKLKAIQAKGVHLSISDEKHYALAQVIIEI